MFRSITEIVIVIYRLNYRKVAALRRTIDEAQISLAKQTGCVCATFWAAPIPFRGGRVSAYA